MRKAWSFGFAVLMAAMVSTREAHAQGAVEEETIEAATRVLKEVMAVPLKGIPASLMKDAQGVAIVPGLIRGGFIVGVEHGKGVIVTRDKTGAWQSPNFISITGGGIGFQAGLQATDVILVFRTQSSVQGLLRGKFTLGADASIAAGPVGGQMYAATDITFKSEILSYSRSRGIFAGVALDGAALNIDQRANAAFYQPGRPYPQAALTLLQLIASYSAPVGAGNERENVRRQLAESWSRLYPILDPQWQQYLAIPAQGELTGVRARYQTVAGNPQYRSLADRHEFQETFALLNREVAIETQNANVLQLPPPPK